MEIYDLKINGIREPLGFELPKAIFGLLVTVWLVLNEMLSVVENAGRMGAPVPPWLARCVASLKDKLDQEAEQELGEDEHE